jgi:hypothetical protein
MLYSLVSISQGLILGMDNHAESTQLGRSIQD